MRSVALLVASLCPLLHSASAKLTWGTTKNLFVFGDSYTTTGYNVTLGIDSPTPGWTSSNGPNWVMSLTDTYNVNQTKVYNLAYGGATTDSQLVTPYLPTVISFDDQVDLWNKYFSPPPELAPWKSSDTLFAIMIGINDIGNSWYWVNVTQAGFHKTLLNRYFDLVEDLYSRGARSFAFVNVPPIDRAPLFIEQGANATAAVKASLLDYNKQFAARVKYFKATHKSLDRIVLFDAYNLYSKLLDNASTLGFVNATGYCSAYANGTPSHTTQVAGCAPVSQYFWLNSLHPGFAVHNSMALALATALS